MTRTTIALLTSAAMVLGSAVTLSGQGKKGSAPKPTHVTTSKPSTTKVSSPKAPAGSKKTTTASHTSKGAKAPKTTTAKATKAPKTTKTAKSTTKTSTKSAKADTKKTTKVAKADSKPSKTEKTKNEKTTTTTTTTTTGDGDTPTLTKVQEKLQKNTKLAEKLEGRLPKGTDLMEAAEGFKNLGQFVAAVNVSNNLGLDFEKLKTAMVDDGKSLGQAIQYVKSDVESPTLVAQRAETDAQTLIQQTETQTTTTTTTSTTTTTATKTKSKNKPGRTLRTQSGS